MIVLAMLTVFILFVTYRMDENERRYKYDGEKSYEAGFREGFKRASETNDTVNNSAVTKRSKK